MSDDALEELRRLAEKATPGPRRWEINVKHKSVTLNGGNPKEGYGRYDLDIMQFARWGMSGATVRFRNQRDIMQDAKDFAAVVPGREHHSEWFQTLKQPDADFIAACDPQTILSLLDRLKAAEANQRTPYTVEVCEKCGRNAEHYGPKCKGHDTELGHLSCPLRTKDTP